MYATYRKCIFCRCPERTLRLFWSYTTEWSSVDLPARQLMPDPRSMNFGYRLGVQEPRYRIGCEPWTKSQRRDNPSSPPHQTPPPLRNRIRRCQEMQHIISNLIPSSKSMPFIIRVSPRPMSSRISFANPINQPPTRHPPY